MNVAARTRPAPHPQPEAIGAAVVPLLSVAVFINYVDRGNLAIAAPLLTDQLALSGTQLGLLLSAFFWSYVPAQILAGWLAERINAYRTLALGLVLWSTATIVTGLVSGFGTLIMLRILLGLGESATMPCNAKLLAQHLPVHKLAGANGLVAAGQALGPAFGTFVGGLLITQIGWRGLFVLFGLLSLIWLAPWYAATRRATVHSGAEPGNPGPSLTTIARRSELWGGCLGHFCLNYAFYFVLSWLPLYFVKSRGMSVAQMAKIGGLIYVVYAVSSLIVGRLSDRWMATGASANRVHKTGIIAGHAVIAASLLAASLGGLTVAVISLMCAGAAFGLTTPALLAIVQTLGGPRAAGKWMGIQNCVGNLAGIVAPVVTGLVIDTTGQYSWAFAISAAMALIGIVGWGLMIAKVAPLDWGPSEPGASLDRRTGCRG